MSLFKTIFRLKNFFQKIFSSEQGKYTLFYDRIRYRFKNELLFVQALTHRSSIGSTCGMLNSNERLEFLGDAVLGLVVTEELYRRFPQGREGDLTRVKSLLVSREKLAEEAMKIGLGEYLILSPGEEQTGGRKRQSILSDAYEALLGAIFLDGGYSAVRRIVCQNVLQNVTHYFSSAYNGNYKSWLLEYAQAQGWGIPVYRLKKEAGPDHRKQFTVEVLVNNKVWGIGLGHNKKKAEQAAAKMAIEQLGLSQKIDHEEE